MRFLSNQNLKNLETAFNQSEFVQDGCLAPAHFTRMLQEVGLMPALVPIVVDYALRLRQKPFIEYSAFIELLNSQYINTEWKTAHSMLREAKKEHLLKIKQRCFCKDNGYKR